MKKLVESLYRESYDSVVLDKNNSVHPDQHQSVIVERFASKMLVATCDAVFNLHDTEPGSLAVSPEYLRYRVAVLLGTKS
jgi:hypothetical protein